MTPKDRLEWPGLPARIRQAVVNVSAVAATVVALVLLGDLIPGMDRDWHAALLLASAMAGGQVLSVVADWRRHRRRPGRPTGRDPS